MSKCNAELAESNRRLKLSQNKIKKYKDKTSNLKKTLKILQYRIDELELLKLYYEGRDRLLDNLREENKKLKDEINLLLDKIEDLESNQYDFRDYFGHRYGKTMFNNYYDQLDALPRTFAEACDVLEVPHSGLSKSEYKKAYRKRAQEYHSDRIQGAGKKIIHVAEQEIKRINEAWSIINKTLPG